MVHIKKVEIFGFKSFGFKNTVVDFQPGLISISGPNGSGKSNILDAIIFAMGENRFKIMRAPSLKALVNDMKDSRRSTKMARVSVHFSNADRGIPVESDSVEITREMSDQGNSDYYLNKKQTKRGHILELLNLANAGLNQLNAVQQGTVTRISEFTPEEKRKVIEDIVGLTDFDEKKERAEKNLAAADGRLDVAMAKMDENKKLVDDLEAGRNVKLRHDMLGREIGRLSAISATRRLRKIKAQIEESRAEYTSLSSEKDVLDARHQNLASEISAIEEEKAGFRNEASTFYESKGGIEKALAESHEEYEKAKASVMTAERRMIQIDEKIPRIAAEADEFRSLVSNTDSEMAEAQAESERLESERNKIVSETDSVNSEMADIISRQADVLKRKNIYDVKIKKMGEELNAENLKLATLRSRDADAGKKIEENSSKREAYRSGSVELSGSRQKLEHIATGQRASASRARDMISALGAKKSKIQKDIDYLSMMLEKSSRAGNQYDARIKMVRTMMHEDYSTAKLKEKSGELGILGLAYELVSWEKKYERAVLAVGSDWIKATVVRDFAALVGLAEYVRAKKLPKLKIIPVEDIPRFRMEPPRQRGISGILSDHISCDRRYSALKEFLFGSVLVADSKESAYAAAKSGYKAVTLAGEFFESDAKAVVIDIDSKISKLTKIISMSTSVEGLLASIAMLKKYVQKKRHALARTDESVREYQGRLQKYETRLATSTEALDNLASQMEGKVRVQEQISSRISALEAQRGRLAAEISKQESHIESLSERISLTGENYSDAELQRIAAQLESLNVKKTDAQSRQAEILDEYHAAHTRMTRIGAKKASQEAKIGSIHEETERLESERDELVAKMDGHKTVMREKESELGELRQKEQELIATSGSSMAKIKEYDEQLGRLNGEEKEVTSQINKLMRQTDSASRDLEGFEEKGAGILATLKSLRPADPADVDDGFEVGQLTAALEAERRAAESVLNANAPAKYIEISGQYRSMSTRKNALEEERNKIVSFIEEIEKDKKQTFLNAFDIVDKEIRHVFAEMTGGNAWLELQDEDDIFGSGISYMIQFKNKPKRESTSISGGEKTLAAVVFVLALQKLKPSPFYLFDEVDAHLDAPNAESLARILGDRSKESQFIMVSLKESVVQRAKLIYGVYPDKGVSNVVTYKDKRVPSVPHSKAKGSV